MENFEVLVFEIFGDYGCFRIPYTTTSVVSYPFPPRTVIAGLLGAILGLEKESYDDVFNEEGSKLSLLILNKIKKVKMGLNLLNTKYGITPTKISKGGKTLRAQIPFEFLKDPKYRIYVWLKDNSLFKKLEELLRAHTPVYTPYLGIASAICDFRFVGKFKAENKKNENVEVHTIIPKKYIGSVIIENGKKYQIIKRLPHYIANSREVTKFEDFLYEVDGKTIKLKIADYFEVDVNGERQNIIFY